jgi:SAM-dependent methyltransferase
MGEQLTAKYQMCHFEQCDTIFAVEILALFDDETLNNGLNEIGRVLCKGDHLIITVPYKEDLKQNRVL